MDPPDLLDEFSYKVRLVAEPRQITRECHDMCNIKTRICLPQVMNRTDKKASQGEARTCITLFGRQPGPASRALARLRGQNAAGPASCRGTR